MGRSRIDVLLAGSDGTHDNGLIIELKAAKDDAAAQARVMAKVDEIIKGTYRVLLSRGRRGCFVWCKDAALREYLKQRLALATPPAA